METSVPLMLLAVILLRLQTRLTSRSPMLCIPCGQGIGVGVCHGSRIFIVIIGVQNAALVKEPPRMEITKVMTVLEVDHHWDSNTANRGPSQKWFIHPTFFQMINFFQPFSTNVLLLAWTIKRKINIFHLVKTHVTHLLIICMINHTFRVWELDKKEYVVLADRLTTHFHSLLYLFERAWSGL